MTTSTITELIERINGGVTYRDGFEFRAIDWSKRHGGSILVQVDYQTHDYSQRFAPNYAFDALGHRKPTVSNRWHFAIVPAHWETDLEFWREFYAQLQVIDSHENREAFRIWDGEKWHGMFNPHVPDGQRNYWGDDVRGMRDDLALGDLNLPLDAFEREFELA